MKLLATLTLAALMGAGAAMAASTPTATPAASATPAATTSAEKHAAHCEKQAEEKKLTGEAKDKFLAKCKEGKKAS